MTQDVQDNSHTLCATDEAHADIQSGSYNVVFMSYDDTLSLALQVRLLHRASRCQHRLPHALTGCSTF